MKYFYTLFEGGKWFPLNYKVSEEEVKKEIVANYNGRCTYVGEREIFAFRFPNGLIWDSYLGEFYIPPYKELIKGYLNGI